MSPKIVIDRLCNLKIVNTIVSIPYKHKTFLVTESRSIKTTTINNYGEEKTDCSRSYSRRDCKLKESWIPQQVINNGEIIVHRYNRIFADCMTCAVNKSPLASIATNCIIPMYPIRRKSDRVSCDFCRGIEEAS